MRYKEIIKFQEGAYCKKIREISYTLETLCANIYKKRGRINICAWSLGAALGTAFLSYGVSLVAAAYHARNMWVQVKKLHILEAEWVRRGETKLRQRKRDILIPAGIGVATVAVGWGIGEAMAVAGAVNVDQAAGHAVHLVAHHIGALVHHLSDVGSGAVHGFHEALLTLGTANHANLHNAMYLQNAAANVTMNAANFVIPVPGADAQALGLAIGMQGAQSSAAFATGQIIDTSGEGVRNRMFRPKRNRI